jgi:dienelactone hydrolase
VLAVLRHVSSRGGGYVVLDRRSRPKKVTGMRRCLLACAALALAAAGCSSSPSGAPQVRLRAGPAAAAFDTPVQITVSGLRSAGLVTLQARTLDRQGRLWESAAQFRASAAGTLNLATAVPVSGSYSVADAAGLLWSLYPAFITDPGAQFSPSSTGFSVRLQVLVGGQVQAAATLVRQWLPAISPSVQTVSRDGFASTLFTPNRPRPGAPAVVVIGGSEGGEETLTAAALAMIGYPALALGYFQEPGLPPCLCDIPLEYFARAIGWLRAQPVARGRPVVLDGGSRGAEGALLIASYEPHLVDAVVADSPSYLIHPAYDGTGAAWTFHGTPLTTSTNIPVGNIRVPLLLGDGGQDAVWDSAGSATRIMQELRGSADRAPYINLYYPGAGHGYFGIPPYFPWPAYDGPYSPLGGTVQANALATEQFWTRMITFLNHL